MEAGAKSIFIVSKHLVYLLDRKFLIDIPLCKSNCGSWHWLAFGSGSPHLQLFTRAKIDDLSFLLPSPVVSTVIVVCVPFFNATQGQEILTSGIWAANECAYQCPEVRSQVSSEWCKVMLGSIFRVATGTMALVFSYTFQI